MNAMPVITMAAAEFTFDKRRARIWTLAGFLCVLSAVCNGLHFSVPLFTNRFSFASGIQYMGSRQTDDGFRLPPVFLADITLASKLWREVLQPHRALRQIRHHATARKIGVSHAYVA